MQEHNFQVRTILTRRIPNSDRSRLSLSLSLFLVGGDRIGATLVAKLMRRERNCESERNHHLSADV